MFQWYNVFAIMANGTLYVAPLDVKKFIKKHKQPRNHPLKFSTLHQKQPVYVCIFKIWFVVTPSQVRWCKYLNSLHHLLASCEELVCDYFVLLKFVFLCLDIGSLTKSITLFMGKNMVPKWRFSDSTAKKHKIYR